MNSKNQAQDRIFLGRETGLLKKPFYLDSEVRKSHTLIVGMTGSGKSCTLQNLIKQDYIAGKSIMIVDGKGDIELGNACKDKDKKFILFSASPKGNCYFNPLKGDVSEVVNNFFIATQEKFNQPYFREFARAMLTGYLLLCKYYGEEPSFTNAHHMATEIGPFREKITAVADLRIRRIFSPILDMKISDFRENHSGLAACLSNIISSPWIEFLETRTDLEELNFELLGQEKPAFIYVGLQKLSNLEGSSLIGRLVLLKLGNISAKRAAAVSSQIPTYNDSIHAFVDELHGICFSGLESLTQTARSSRIALTFATQTLSDLNLISPDFKQQILTNTACKIIHLQNSHLDAEAFAKHFGDELYLNKKGQRLGFFNFFATSPHQLPHQRDRKEERVWTIEPNVFKNLKRGEAIIEIIYPTKKIVKKVKVAKV